MEFALAAPVVFLIVFAIFQIGYVLLLQHLLTDTAREGCRLACIANASNSEIESACREMLKKGGLKNIQIGICVDGKQAECSEAEMGDEIQVSVSGSSGALLMVPAALRERVGAAACARRKE